LSVKNTPNNHSDVKKERTSRRTKTLITRKAFSTLFYTQQELEEDDRLWLMNEDIVYNQIPTEKAPGLNCLKKEHEEVESFQRMDRTLPCTSTHPTMELDSVYALSLNSHWVDPPMGTSDKELEEVSSDLFAGKLREPLQTRCSAQLFPGDREGGQCPTEETQGSQEEHPGHAEEILTASRNNTDEETCGEESVTSRSLHDQRKTSDGSQDGRNRQPHHCEKDDTSWKGLTPPTLINTDPVMELAPPDLLETLYGTEEDNFAEHVWSIVTDVISYPAAFLPAPLQFQSLSHEETRNCLFQADHYNRPQPKQQTTLFSAAHRNQPNWEKHVSAGLYHPTDFQVYSCEKHLNYQEFNKKTTDERKEFLQKHQDARYEEVTPIIADDFHPEKDICCTYLCSEWHVPVEDTDTFFPTPLQESGRN